LIRQNHLSEKLVGLAIKADRERWIVATKFGHRYTTLFGGDQLWGVYDVRPQLELSLSALAVDAIDLYQFHPGKNDVFENDALWTMRDKQKEAETIRHLGIQSPAPLDTRTSSSRRSGCERWERKSSK
jgi:aryl-alcohol dehydrogenase-like predicted oxidoreductase